MTRPAILSALLLITATVHPLPKTPQRVSYEAPPQLMRNIMALLDAAREFGVDPKLVFSVAWEESELKEWAQSRREVVVNGKKVWKIIARGLMQISKQHQDEHVRKYLPGLHPANFQWINPVHSARLGCAILADFIKRYSGSKEYACVAYNSGPFWADLSIRAPAVPLKKDTKKYLGDIFGRA